MASQLEFMHAREVFPCFDEPGFRATFETTLLYPQKYLALSNMPVLQTNTIDDHHVQTSFQKTPPMSTYLFAVVLHNFPKFTVGKDRNLTIYARPDSIAKIRPAFDKAEQILEALEEYTGLNYSLPKMDHLFMASYDGGGFMSSMENWGLTTFV